MGGEDGAVELALLVDQSAEVLDPLLFDLRGGRRNWILPLGE